MDLLDKCLKVLQDFKGSYRLIYTRFVVVRVGKGFDAGLRVLMLEPGPPPPSLWNSRCEGCNGGQLADSS